MDIYKNPGQNKCPNCGGIQFELKQREDGQVESFKCTNCPYEVNLNQGPKIAENSIPEGQIILE